MVLWLAGWFLQSEIELSAILQVLSLPYTFWVCRFSFTYCFVYPVYQFVLHPYLPTCPVSMTCLHHLGISAITPKRISFQPSDTVMNGRGLIFEECVHLGLAPHGVALVPRRDTAANPITSKDALDIWMLTNCPKHKKIVPRVLVNGSRHYSQKLDCHLHIYHTLWNHCNPHNQCNHCCLSVAHVLHLKCSPILIPGVTSSIIMVVVLPLHTFHNTFSQPLWSWEIIMIIHIIKNNLQSRKSSLSSLQSY